MVRNNTNYRIIRVRNSNQPAIVYGNGIIYDTWRMLGRKMAKGGKYLLKQYIFPTALKLGKEALNSGKRLFSEAKSEIQKIVSDGTAEIIDKIINNPKDIKNTVIDTSNKIKQNVIDPTIDKSKDEVNRIINKIISGQGIGIIKNKNIK